MLPLVVLVLMGTPEKSTGLSQRWLGTVKGEDKPTFIQ